MATIMITDLRPAGVNLFMDSESFLDEFNSDELGNMNGNALPFLVAGLPESATNSSAFCISAFISATAVIASAAVVTVML